MIAEVGAGVEPEVEDLAQAGLADLPFATGVHKADDGDVFVVEGAEELLRHGADGGKAAVAAVAATREVVDRDGDLAVGGRDHEGAEEQGGEYFHRVESGRVRRSAGRVLYS